MKLRLTFEVEVDEEGLAAYHETYPRLADGERPWDTLAREAIAQWESDDLVHPGAECTHVWEVNADEASRQERMTRIV